MKLNHINLVVKDVVNATRFFENFFGFKCTEVKGDYKVAILKGTGDFTLVIMKRKESDPDYPDSFHIGFMQESKDKVIELHKN